MYWLILILGGVGVSLLLLSLFFFIKDKKRQPQFQVGDIIKLRPTIGEFAIYEYKHCFVIKAVGKQVYLARLVTDSGWVIDGNKALSFDFAHSLCERAKA